MQFIQGVSRHQTYFSTLENQVSADNAVRLIDAFVDKPDLQKLGFTKTIHSAEGRPPYAPAVLFLPCRTQILTFNNKRSTLLLTA